MTGEKNLPRGMPHGYWCGVVRNQIVLKPCSWKGNLKTYQEKELSNLYLSISEIVGRDDPDDSVRMSSMLTCKATSAFESRHPDSFFFFNETSTTEIYKLTLLDAHTTN